MVEIDRRLAVGLFILGALSHYDKEDIIKYNSIQYIAKQLSRKHFPIKNGTAKQRFNRDLLALNKANIIWECHASVSDRA